MSASERLPQPEQNDDSDRAAIERAKEQSRRIDRAIQQSKRTTQRAKRRLRRAGY